MAKLIDGTSYQVISFLGTFYKCLFNENFISDGYKLSHDFYINMLFQIPYFSYSWIV